MNLFDSMRLDLMIIMGSIIIIIINIIIIRVLLYFLQLSFNLLNIWCFFFFVSILQTLIIMNTTNHLNGSETRCFFFVWRKRGWMGERKRGFWIVIMGFPSISIAFYYPHMFKLLRSYFIQQNCAKPHYR